MKRRVIFALLAVLMMAMSLSAVSLAEPAQVEIPDTASVGEAIAEQTAESEEAYVIQVREHMEPDFEVMLDYRGTDSNIPAVSYYSSIKDIVAHLGDDLYYTAYEPWDNSGRPFIIYSGRGYYDEQTGELDGHYAFQMNYMLDEKIQHFWIEVGCTKEDWMYDPNAERYEALDTVFYISDWHEWIDGCFTEGVIDGNLYSFVAKDHQEAKLIIDNLTKAE